MDKVIEIKTKRKIHKKYSFQFLPTLLEEISKSKTIKYKNGNLKSAYLVDIIHNLLLRYYFKKENSFNLSSLILKEKYGHKYNYYINYLTENNLLILIKNHLKGKNSRVYKLNDSVITEEIKRYKNCDNILLKKSKTFIDTEERSNILPEIKAKLIKDLYSVEIDFQKSIFYLDSTNPENDVYNKNKYIVESIHGNHIFYHFDAYGRMHTNFTILKSYIRKNCLLIGGEETFEMDIKNSQPLFLYKLICDNDTIIVDHNELELFKSLTMSGDFYQYVIDKSGLQMSKRDIKEIIYKVLFGRNYNTKSDRLFKKTFPTIHAFIKAYKVEMGDYRKMAYDLQRAESNLIFNKIIKKIMDLYPEINLITVHDSIICSKKHKDVVEIIFDKILKEEFEVKI